MRLSRAALASALGAAVVLGWAASPASAATLAPEQTTCFAAQQQLTLDQHTLAVAQAADNSEDNAITGGADFTPDADDIAKNNAQAVVNTDVQEANALCGTSVGVPSPTPVPFPHRHHIPVGLPVGVLPGGDLSCAQIEAQGVFPSFCQTQIPIGSLQTVQGVHCSYNGTSWVPLTAIPVGTPLTVNGTPCTWSGTSWVPVPVTVTAPAPSCGCAPAAVTAPAPSQPTNINTNTINITPTSMRVATSSTPAGSSQPSTADITVPPVQTGPSYSQIGGTAPAGAADTGFGGMADIIDPSNPNPDPTVQLTLNLGNLLNLGSLPSLPGLSGSGLPL